MRGNIIRMGDAPLTPFDDPSSSLRVVTWDALCDILVGSVLRVVCARVVHPEAWDRLAETHGHVRGV